jgi:hypothetical protein
VGETIRIAGDATIIGPYDVRLPTHHGPYWRRRDGIVSRHPGAGAPARCAALPSVGRVPL